MHAAPCVPFLKRQHTMCPGVLSTWAEEEWQQQIEVLDNWFASHRTSPHIASCLFQLLQLIRMPSEEPIIADDPHVAKALASQQRIGSKGLLEGRLSLLWLPLQPE